MDRQRRHRVRIEKPAEVRRAEDARAELRKVQKFFVLGSGAYLMYEPKSLDGLASPGDPGSEGNLHELVSDGSTPVDEVVACRMDLEKIKGLLSRLEPCDEIIIRHRYGLVDGREWGLEEIAMLLGLSRERVRQREGMAILALRKYVLSPQRDHRFAHCPGCREDFPRSSFYYNGMDGHRTEHVLCADCRVNQQNFRRSNFVRRGTDDILHRKYADGSQRNTARPGKHSVKKSLDGESGQV